MTDDLFPISLDEMIEEVRRECQVRRQVYPRLVADKKLNRRQSDRRIDVMDAVLQHLEDEREEAERAAGR